MNYLMKKNFFVKMRSANLKPQNNSELATIKSGKELAK